MIIASKDDFIYKLKSFINSKVCIDSFKDFGIYRLLQLQGFFGIKENGWHFVLIALNCIWKVG